MCREPATRAVLFGRLRHRPDDTGAVEWPDSFYALRRGEGCPMCEQGRPDETPYGIRIFAGEVTDAYLQRAPSSAATRS